MGCHTTTEPQAGTARWCGWIQPRAPGGAGRRVATAPPGQLASVALARAPTHTDAHTDGARRLGEPADRARGDPVEWRRPPSGQIAERRGAAARVDVGRTPPVAGGMRSSATLTPIHARYIRTVSTRQAVRLALSGRRPCGGPPFPDGRPADTGCVSVCMCVLCCVVRKYPILGACLEINRNNIYRSETMLHERSGGDDAPPAGAVT